MLEGEKTDRRDRTEQHEVHHMRSGPVSISIAMVTFGKGAKISASAIQRDLQATWPQLPAISKPERDGNTVAFKVGEADVILGIMPTPLPWTDLEGPCATSWLWPEAADAMRHHKTHIIVTVTFDGEPLERVKLLTAVTASLVETSSQVAGVYWCDSTVVMSPSMFRDLAVEMLPDGFPLYAWIDLRAGSGEDGKTAGFTSGMTALGHMDFETLNSPEQPGELRERFFGLAYYVLENGPVIKDGDTIGEDENERIKVIYSESSFGHDKPVMRLDYEAAAGKGKKKPFWRRAR